MENKQRYIEIVEASNAKTHLCRNSFTLSYISYAIPTLEHNASENAQGGFPMAKTKLYLFVNQ